MLTGKTVADRALTYFEGRDLYCYLFSSKGARIVSLDQVKHRVQEYWGAHFKAMNWTDADSLAYYNENKGKWAFDCSGFVCEVAQIPQRSSQQLHDGATKIVSLEECHGDYSMIPAGVACWKSGHIGIYRGDGTSIDSASERDGLRARDLKDYDWTHFLWLDGVEYPTTSNNILTPIRDVYRHKIIKGKDGINPKAYALPDLTSEKLITFVEGMKLQTFLEQGDWYLVGLSGIEPTTLGWVVKADFEG